MAQLDGNPLAGLFAIMFSGVWLVVSLGVYLFTAYCYMVVANKLNVENGWLAFIPIGNLYLLTQCARVDWWWMLVAIFICLIPILGAIASIVIMAWMAWRVCENLGKPGPLIFLALIPGIGAIVLAAYLAFAD